MRRVLGNMAACKFAAIIRMVAERVELEDTALLTFEVSDGDRPIPLYRVGEPVVVGDEVHVRRGVSAGLVQAARPLAGRARSPRGRRLLRKQVPALLRLMGSSASRGKPSEPISARQ
ncbi:hypothetical protein SAZ10_12335 [Mesorhizobium sp. BAC0120]|uniref:hypothetical protein n=1 Tax=Mesorhizobium sp. BAC0120 TaxID=3090670 RepID=UPI00298C37CC|nr:hypothetical protein [Mesorhizobium sp. BAC0120]MDW6022542.1 hypothetical protein [Mesorhizobium sp. BAC0120]